MGVMNIFAGIHSSAEEHGNEHNLPGPEVRHVCSFKETAQLIILQEFAIEKFRSSIDGATSPDQFIEVFSHGVLINNGSEGDVTTVGGFIRVDRTELGRRARWRARGGQHRSTCFADVFPLWISRSPTPHDSPRGGEPNGRVEETRRAL